MAKQTFTTGQVLTAVQMSSLQATALGGGDTTAKVASYVLVAADAGTTVAMNAAGATTITVNTALFAAGDTVFIQNRGAGACTVTAGTATVATAGSLILPQNDAGILYFTATGASIFYDYIQAGAVSPLTTKGDVYTFSTSDARLAVGTNGQVLTANSAAATGLEYTTISAGGMTLISTTTASSTSVTLSSIPQSYKSLYIVCFGFTVSSGNGGQRITPNNTASVTDSTFTMAGVANGLGDSVIRLDGGGDVKGSDANNAWAITIHNYTSATSYKPFEFDGFLVNPSSVNKPISGGGAFRSNTAITSLVFDREGNTFTAGTILLYGVN